MPLSAGEQRQVPVVPVVATTSQGIDRLMTAIDEHRAYLSASGQAAERAETAARSEVLTRLRAEIERRLDEASGELPAVQAAIADVAARRATSGEAVRTLIEPLLRHRD
jgi:putative protein kinase ArgK-like GTPase of G3E family